MLFFFFFFNDTATTEIYTLSLHDALPISFYLNRFGAKGDGVTDCTAAFRSAIDECTKAGGGKVVVPAGTYLTGAIHLKNNVNLEVSEGDRKSTRLNSRHSQNSYAVFCLKKKKKKKKKK